MPPVWRQKKEVLELKHARLPRRRLAAERRVGGEVYPWTWGIKAQACAQAQSLRACEIGACVRQVPNECCEHIHAAMVGRWLCNVNLRSGIVRLGWIGLMAGVFGHRFWFHSLRLSQKS